MATGGTVSALRFEFERVRDTGREVRHGLYTMVKQLKFRGLKCAWARKFMTVCSISHVRGTSSVAGAFEGECIMQFLSVCLEQGSPLPMLVMEYLHTTLFACPERCGVPPDRGDQLRNTT